MKKENVQNTSEKRSVNDFEHRMTIQLTEQHYIDYAMAHSQDQIKKGRQRAILWAVLFTVVGCVAIYRGAFMEGWMSEIYLVAGVLGLCAVMIVTSGYIKVILSIVALVGVAFTVARIARYPHDHHKKEECGGQQSQPEHVQESKPEDPAGNPHKEA